MKKIITFVLILCLLLQVLAACNIAEKEYEFIESKFRFVETYGDRLVYDSEAYYIETAHAYYYFDKAISYFDMNNCVRSSEKILEYINSADKINIYIISDYTEKYIGDNSFFCGDVKYKSVEYIADLLLVSYGKFCNYGLSYGYANYIAQQLEWEYETENNGFSICDISVYDLNLLCFDNQFVSENEINACKTLSIKFVNDYISKNGETDFVSMFKSSSNTDTKTQFTSALIDWYKQNGITYTPTFVKYAYGGETHEYHAVITLFFILEKTGKKFFIPI